MTKKLSSLIAGIAVLFALAIGIAFLYGYFARPLKPNEYWVTNPTSALSLMIFLIFGGFVGGFAIGMFLEANAKEWITELTKKAKEKPQNAST